jgi:hypothetical protein
LIDANASDAGDGLASIFQASLLELFLGLYCGGDGAIDVVKDAPMPRLTVGRRRFAGPHVRQDFLNDAADEFIVDLHGLIPLKRSSSKSD